MCPVADKKGGTAPCPIFRGISSLSREKEEEEKGFQILCRLLLPLLSVVFVDGRKARGGGGGGIKVPSLFRTLLFRAHLPATSGVCGLRTGEQAGGTNPEELLPAFCLPLSLSLSGDKWLAEF